MTAVFPVFRERGKGQFGGGDPQFALGGLHRTKSLFINPKGGVCPSAEEKKGGSQKRKALACNAKSPEVGRKSANDLIS